MPRTLGSGEVLKLLEQHGFSFVSQKGSHVKLSKVRHQKEPELLIWKTVVAGIGRRVRPEKTLRGIFVPRRSATRSLMLLKRHKENLFDHCLVQQVLFPAIRM